MRIENWSQDVWLAPVEKTTGEPLLRVQGVERGQGMEAYRRLHRWYGAQTDMCLAELRPRALMTTQAKKEEDVARCMDAWQASIMELRRVYPDYKGLPDAYQTAAIRGLRTGRYRDHIDMKLVANTGMRAI